MDFGQSLDPIELSQMTMTLPNLDSPEERAQLERLAKAGARSQSSPQIFVGAPIWSHAPWVGNLYSESATTADFLREYATQMNTVEVNSTFYAIPTAETFLKWKESVGSAFRFCPKFPKSISHSLNGKHPDLKIFADRILSLEGNLGATFLQLPQYFSIRDQDRLLALLSQIPRELKTVVELRNADFFSHQRLKPETLELLAKSYAGSVSVDTPLERPVAHVSLTSTRAMVRFLGANLHDSDLMRLKQWAARLVLWFRQGLKEIYFLLHEPDNSLAPQAVDLFVKMLNEELVAQGVQYRLNPIQWNRLL